MVKAAIVLPGEGCSLADVDLGPVGAGRVRVAMAAVGVCRSDLSIADGTIPHRLPAVLGHEGAGHVVEVGPGVSGVAVGDPVVLNWMPACGRCRWCRAEQPFLCSAAAAAGQADYARTGDGTVLGAALGTGAFAEEVIVTERAVVPIPREVPLDQAALLGCMMLTGYGAVTRAAGVRPGESVLVFGAGGIGQAVIAAARLAGADPIIAVDTDPAKEESCLANGATVFCADKAAAVRQTAAATERAGADHVFDCVGSAETIRLAWRLTRRGGATTVVGIGPAGQTVQFNAQELSTAGKTLRGCVYGDSLPELDIPVLVELLRTGRLDLAGLIGDRVGLVDLP
ncbi:MAG: alcohol dehydrogenase catalytic domain-containing protein, partial [Catenulispora sp.]|nr:alcohol dehydrogenase catalytic domain-containing protein [Catenulispora sp.]